jgi:hypothetical protein
MRNYRIELFMCVRIRKRYFARPRTIATRNWLPATWRPDPYQDWTFTSKQTMTFQDTPRGVGTHFLILQFFE